MWGRQVKSDIFVVTLFNHLRSEFSSDELWQDNDQWAISLVQAHSLHGVMEAFDSDHSGYITTDEVNALTESLPKELDWR